MVAGWYGSWICRSMNWSKLGDVPKKRCGKELLSSRISGHSIILSPAFPVVAAGSASSRHRSRSCVHSRPGASRCLVGEEIEH